jgi:hypothetical protein
MRQKVLTLFILASAGLIFSGYLSGVKLISGSCALNEPCPYFLGYPACWYGFAMYLAMFIVTAVALANDKHATIAIKADLAISFVGILFAGNFVLQEIERSTVTGTLGLSTCVYGLIFYIAIFIVSGIAIWRLKEYK